VKGGPAPSGSGASGPPSNRPPPCSTTTARKDHTGGKLELALQEFQDYLRNTTATRTWRLMLRFYIGNIHFAQEV